MGDTDMTELRCFPRHLRSNSICMAGGRAWFKQHNIDWSRFVIEGVDAEVLRATGDPFAMKVVESAEREAARG